MKIEEDNTQEREEEWAEKDYVRTSCTSWRHEKHRHDPLPCRPGALLPCLSSPPKFRPPPFPVYFCFPPPPRIAMTGVAYTPHVAPLPPSPLDTTHGVCAALPIQLWLRLVPPHHQPFGCFEDPPVPLSRLVCCSGPQSGPNSTHQGGKLRLPFGCSEFPQIFDYASMSSLKLSARSLVLPNSHHPEQYPTRYSLLSLPCHGPRKEEPPFTNGRFDALATCHLQGL